jgi:hypothetical protein
VEARKLDELEAIAHAAQLLLEGGDLVVAEMALPVEGGGAVVGEDLAGEALVDRLGDRPRMAIEAGQPGAGRT